MKLLQIIFLLFCIPIAYAQEAKITQFPVVKNTSNNHKYLHMNFEITGKNLLEIEDIKKNIFFSDGGQFQVYIKKSSFPISAPNCKGNIILRMPWSSKEQGGIDKKYAVYKFLDKIKLGEKDKLNVTLELNPYVKVSNNSYKLTQCNVFFRTANGKYINNTKPLNDQ